MTSTSRLRRTIRSYELTETLRRGGSAIRRNATPGSGVPNPRALVVLLLGILSASCGSAECAEGLVRVAGRCQSDASCGTCGERQFCDFLSGPAQCTCVPGYSGEPCEFDSPSTFVSDPGFEEDVDTGPWDGSLGATIRTERPGDLNPGVGAIDRPSVLCNSGALSQGLSMPNYSLADPFVAEIRYKTAGDVRPAVGFNRAWKQLPPSSDWTTARFCLGEGAYALEGQTGDVELKLAASDTEADCAEVDAGDEILIDQVSIELADASECLAPGAVVNGDAQPNLQGWRFLTTGSAVGGFTTDTELFEDPPSAPPQNGFDGGTGVRLKLPAGETGEAALATRISVPVPPANEPDSVALRFWWRGSSGSVWEVHLGDLATVTETDSSLVPVDDPGRNVDTLVGTDSPAEFSYCLPPWTHGSELDLTFSLRDAGTEDANLVVDRVSVSTSADCQRSESLGDPGFEAGPDNRWFGASVGSRLEQVLLVSSGVDPRAGSGALVMQHQAIDANLGMETFVLVPPTDEGGGPVLRFYTTAPAAVTSEVVVERPGLGPKPVQLETSWMENNVCLPWTWAGRWFPVRISMRSDGAPSVVERVFLDELVLDTDPDCEADPNFESLSADP